MCVLLGSRLIGGGLNKFQNGSLGGRVKGSFFEESMLKLYNGRAWGIDYDPKGSCWVTRGCAVITGAVEVVPDPSRSFGFLLTRG